MKIKRRFQPNAEKAILMTEKLESEVIVQCVFAAADIAHLQLVLIPSLMDSTTRRIRFVCLNYDGDNLIRIVPNLKERLEIVNFPRDAEGLSGFARNHNKMFSSVSALKSFFIIINPDCILMKEAIDKLIETYKLELGSAAIVEGRQWPFEHPKEFNPSTKETPWASGAFALIDSRFYKEVGGMDENFFLYTEDVDLSWRAWLAGYKVLYEREAVVMHFTGGPYYSPSEFEAEKYYSLRNFILISRKYFGEKGEKSAIRQLRLVLDKQHFDWIIRGYHRAKREFDLEKYRGSKHRMVKITGVNLYHEVQK